MHNGDHDPERDGHSHGHGHGHHHHGHNHDHSELDEMELRVRALESLLTEKGYVDPPALDALIETPATPLVRRSSRMRRCSAAVASETMYISVV